MAPQLRSFPDDPYKHLKERVHQHLKEDKIDDKIFSMVKDACAQALQRENIVLSRVEQNRLLRDILKDQLSEMLAEI